MSESQLGSIILPLFALLVAAQAGGYIFTRFRQPRVIGEIAAGVLLGPSLLAHIAPRLSAEIFRSGPPHTSVLGFVYWLGLLFLMFISGSETRHVFRRDERSQTLSLALFGTGLPFLIALVARPMLPLDWFMGPANQSTALVLVIGIAVAVTSIPVISRIFYDLRILHTRFASLVLGVAVLEDIALWAVLAVATALAGSAHLSTSDISRHVAAAIIYCGLGTAILPLIFRRIHNARWNVLAQNTPVFYARLILLSYVLAAAAFDVSLVFAAFLAGFAVAPGADKPGLSSADSGNRQQLAAALDSIAKFSFAFFVPVYFAIVGYRLNLGRDFSLLMFAAVLGIACILKLAAVWLGARIAGFRGLDTVNLAVAFNARGGPGIVLASVAFDAGIVNAGFYTALVLLAVLTSQAAGFWLDFVLRKQWPLLSSDIAVATAATMPSTTSAPASPATGNQQQAA